MSLVPFDQLPINPGPDLMCEHYTKKGVYIVKIGYHVVIYWIPNPVLLEMRDVQFLVRIWSGKFCGV